MKTSLGTIALAVLLIAMAGCSNCRWPWSRTVTTSMPPAAYPCGPGGPADACAPPALTPPPLTAPAPTVAPVGGAMAAPALAPSPAVPAQTYMPIQQNYTPMPTQSYGTPAR